MANDSTDKKSSSAPTEATTSRLASVDCKSNYVDEPSRCQRTDESATKSIVGGRDEESELEAIDKERGARSKGKPSESNRIQTTFDKRLLGKSRADELININLDRVQDTRRNDTKVRYWDYKQTGIKSKPVKLIKHPVENIEHKILITYLIGFVFKLIAVLTGPLVVAILTVLCLPSYLFTQILGYLLNLIGCLQSNLKNFRWPPKRPNWYRSWFGTKKSSLIDKKGQWLYKPLNYIESYWLRPELVTSVLLTLELPPDSTKYQLDIDKLRLLIKTRLLDKNEFRKFSCRVKSFGIPCWKFHYWKYKPFDFEENHLRDSYSLENHVFEDPDFQMIPDHVHGASMKLALNRRLRGHLKRISSQPLSLRQPLWQLRVLPIPSHSGGKKSRAFLLFRCHQSLADGRALTEMLTHCLAEPEPCRFPSWDCNSNAYIVRDDQLTDGTYALKQAVDELYVKLTAVNNNQDQASSLNPDETSDLRRFIGILGHRLVSLEDSLPFVDRLDRASGLRSAILIGPLTVLLWLIWCFSRRRNNHLNTNRKAMKRDPLIISNKNKPFATKIAHGEGNESSLANEDVLRANSSNLDLHYPQRTGLILDNNDNDKKNKIKRSSNKTNNNEMNSASYLSPDPNAHANPNQDDNGNMDEDGENRIYWASYSLTRFHQITQMTRSTVSDIILCALSGALRDYLRCFNAVNNPPNLNLSLAFDAGQSGPHRGLARVSLVNVPIPVSVEGLVPRLWEIRSTMDELRNSADPWVMLGLMKLLHLLVPTSCYQWIINQLTLRNSSILLSNVRGPRASVESWCKNLFQKAVDEAQQTPRIYCNGDEDKDELNDLMSNNMRELHGLKMRGPNKRTGERTSASVNMISESRLKFERQMLSLKERVQQSSRLQRLNFLMDLGTIESIYYLAEPPSENIPITFNCISYHNELFFTLKSNSLLVEDAPLLMNLFFRQLDQLANTIGKRRSLVALVSRPPKVSIENSEMEQSKELSAREDGEASESQEDEGGEEKNDGHHNLIDCAQRSEFLRKYLGEMDQRDEEESTGGGGGQRGNESLCQIMEIRARLQKHAEKAFSGALMKPRQDTRASWARSTKDDLEARVGLADKCPSCSSSVCSCARRKSLFSLPASNQNPISSSHLVTSEEDDDEQRISGDTRPHQQQSSTSLSSMRVSGGESNVARMQEPETGLISSLGSWLPVQLARHFSLRKVNDNNKQTNTMQQLIESQSKFHNSELGLDGKPNRNLVEAAAVGGEFCYSGVVDPSDRMSSATPQLHCISKTTSDDGNAADNDQNNRLPLSIPSMMMVKMVTSANQQKPSHHSRASHPQISPSPASDYVGVCLCGQKLLEELDEDERMDEPADEDGQQQELTSSTECESRRSSRNEAIYSTATSGSTNSHCYSNSNEPHSTHAHTHTHANEIHNENIQEMDSNNYSYSNINNNMDTNTNTNISMRSGSNINNNNKRHSHQNNEMATRSLATGPAKSSQNGARPTTTTTSDDQITTTINCVKCHKPVVMQSNKMQTSVAAGFSLDSSKEFVEQQTGTKSQHHRDETTLEKQFMKQPNQTQSMSCHPGTDASSSPHYNKTAPNWISNKQRGQKIKSITRSDIDISSGRGRSLSRTECRLMIPHETIGLRDSRATSRDPDSNSNSDSPSSRSRSIQSLGLSDQEIVAHSRSESDLHPSTHNTIKHRGLGAFKFKMTTSKRHQQATTMTSGKPKQMIAFASDQAPPTSKWPHINKEHPWFHIVSRRNPKLRHATAYSSSSDTPTPSASSRASISFASDSKVGKSASNLRSSIDQNRATMREKATRRQSLAAITYGSHSNNSNRSSVFIKDEVSRIE